MDGSLDTHVHSHKAVEVHLTRGVLGGGGEGRGEEGRGEEMERQKEGATNE